MKILLPALSSISLDGGFWGFASVLTICVTAIILQIMKGAKKKE